MGKEYCCVTGCEPRMNQGISFHRFPKDQLKRDKWIDNLQIVKPVFEGTRVCSAHFEESCFIFPDVACKRKRLKRGSFPNKKLQLEMPGDDERKATQLDAEVSKDSASPVIPPNENPVCHINTFVEGFTAKNMANDGMVSWCMDVIVDSTLMAAQNFAQKEIRKTSGDGTCNGSIRAALKNTGIPTPKTFRLRQLEIANLQNRLHMLENSVMAYRRNQLGVENNKNAVETRICEESNKPVSGRSDNEPQTEPSAADVKKSISAPSAEHDLSGVKEKLTENLLHRLERVEQDAKAGCRKASFLLEQYENYDRKKGTWSDGMLHLCAKWLSQQRAAYNLIRRRKILFLPVPDNTRLKQMKS